MAIFIFLFISQVKSPAVVFMLNLAVADVLFVTSLPFNIVYRFSGNNWVIGEGMCRFVTAAFYCNMYCSVLLMTSISVDRFLAVVYPVQSLLWRTVGRAWLVCLFIWMVSITATVPLLMSNLTVHIDHLNITSCCHTQEPEDVQSFYFPYFTTYISVFFFLPFIITTFCYAATIRSLSSPTIDSPFKKSRSVLLCVTVLCEFIFCFGPSNIIFLVYYLTLEKPVGNSMFFAYTLSVCVGSISCCFDPAMYYLGSSKCKKHVYRLICCGKTRIGHSQTRSSSGMTGGESSGFTL
ncbi:PREDICTED: proteinase-activated receptor 1-like [Nanorana parkeri]|uniref:proteinase-activated receptor 1-like n=1 Tax=Nanorana parkeri TaxID=125878 RepID=UPI000853F4A3|nr:PREDICTED: proteinase-activated receptor 1-like [Nanorana parkeri]